MVYLTLSIELTKHSTGLPVVLANKIQGHFQVFKCVLGIFQGYSSIFQGYFPNKKKLYGNIQRGKLNLIVYI